MKVKKMNVVKEIDEKQLSHYEDMGYSRVDKKGNTVKSGRQNEPDKIAALEKEIAEASAAIGSKNERIAALEKELDELKKAAAEKDRVIAEHEAKHK